MGARLLFLLVVSIASEQIFEYPQYLKVDFADDDRQHAYRFYKTNETTDDNILVKYQILSLSPRHYRNSPEHDTLYRNKRGSWILMALAMNEIGYSGLISRETLKDWKPLNNKWRAKGKEGETFLVNTVRVEITPFEFPTSYELKYNGSDAQIRELFEPKEGTGVEGKYRYTDIIHNCAPVYNKIGTITEKQLLLFRSFDNQWTVGEKMDTKQGWPPGSTDLTRIWQARSYMWITDADWQIRGDGTRIHSGLDVVITEKREISNKSIPQTVVLVVLGVCAVAVSVFAVAVQKRRSRAEQVEEVEQETNPEYRNGEYEEQDYQNTKVVDTNDYYDDLP